MRSHNQELLNLERIRRLKAEPPDQREFDGQIRKALLGLSDAQRPMNAPDSRFTLAFDAAHSLALAALRWHGFRSEDRQTVFQVLPHTVGFPTAKWRFLSDCHMRRNAALYEAAPVDDEQLIMELIAVTKELQIAVTALGPVSA